MKRRTTLTHRTFFILGCIYYLIFPQLIGYNNMFNSDMFFNIERHFQIESPWWPYLLTFTIIGPIFYLIGSAWKPLRNTLPHPMDDQYARSAGAWMLIPIYGILLLLFTFQGRHLLFSGYTELVDISLQGQLATLEMLLLFQYLYERSTHRSTSTAFGLLLAANSIVLLSMGGRLYVLSALISVYFRWWNWGASSARSQWQSLLIVLCVPIALVALGMWRVGETQYELVGFYLLAESLYTAISSFTLFTGGQWSFINISPEFLVSFLNLAPSIFWDNKSEWLADIIGTQQKFESPFGAISIIASTVGNFGFFGGLIFFFAVGAYMSVVGQTRGQPVREAYYCYLVGLLPFMFFRDPFQVQVKIVATGFILFWLTKTLHARRRSKANTPSPHTLDQQLSQQRETPKNPD